MSHPDDELLVDLALGSGAEMSTELVDHVNGCPTCATTVEELRRTLVLAANPEGPSTWSAPPETVWSRIEEAIVLDAKRPPSADQAPDIPEPTTRWSAVTTPDATPDATLESRRSARARRQVLPWAAGMAAAGLAVGLLTGRALWSDTPPAPATIAQAELDTLDTNQPLGEARLVRVGGGVDLTVATNRPLNARDGFIEVWLINEDGERMVSVGVFHGSAPVSFPITQALIDQGYVIVDISREGFDNKPQHSGDSLARGTLRS